MAFKFHLGIHAVDQITRFAGVITSRADNITGCNRYYLQPSVDKDGKHIEGGWYDEHALEIDPIKQQLKLHRGEHQSPG